MGRGYQNNENIDKSVHQNSTLLVYGLLGRLGRRPVARRREDERVAGGGGGMHVAVAIAVMVVVVGVVANVVVVDALVVERYVWRRGGASRSDEDIAIVVAALRPERMRFEMVTSESR